MADNKKSAQRKACLDMVIQLYKAGLIPGNKGDRFGQGFNGPKVNNLRPLKNFSFFLSVDEVTVEEVDHQVVVVGHLEDLGVLMEDELLLHNLVAMQAKVHHSQLSHRDGIWPEVIYEQIYHYFQLRI